MKKSTIFAPFYYVHNFEDKEEMSQRYVKPILRYHRRRKILIPFGWQGKLHSTFESNILPRIKGINWNMLQNNYSEQIGNFLQAEGIRCSGYNIENMWLNCYGKDDFQEIHTHNQQGQLFSAIHFLKFDPEKHAPTIFVNDNESYTQFIMKEEILKLRSGCHNTYYSHQYVPEINEGDFLIFPSSLPHFVPRQTTKEVRLTIAMNVRLFLNDIEECDNCSDTSMVW